MIVCKGENGDYRLNQCVQHNAANRVIYDELKQKILGSVEQYKNLPGKQDSRKTETEIIDTVVTNMDETNVWNQVKNIKSLIAACLVVMYSINKEYNESLNFTSNSAAANGRFIRNFLGENGSELFRKLVGIIQVEEFSIADTKMILDGLELIQNKLSQNQDLLSHFKNDILSEKSKLLNLENKASEETQSLTI